jgi:hypothetical protein
VPSRSDVRRTRRWLIGLAVYGVGAILFAVAAVSFAHSSIEDKAPSDLMAEQCAEEREASERQGFARPDKTLCERIVDQMREDEAGEGWERGIGLGQ